MTEFSISKIIEHCFHFYNNKGELDICYDMIIGSDLMVKLFPIEDFKPQVLQWDGSFEKNSGMLG